MSRTLFWYLFKDLLRIFFLASGVIAGIMSFGGLLRPLTHYGLDASQVGKMLTYLMPAMTTYSLPIAALFATTIVYGRLSADNELTACRAAGISYLSVAAPAMVLGLIVAIISLLLLCFIVPAFSLKVQKVIFSNIAQLVAHEIDRSHEVSLKGVATIFAQEAHLPPPDPSRPDEQCVVLDGPTIIDYVKADRDAVPVPRDFAMASRADVYLRRDPANDEVIFQAKLTGGVSFPREFASGWAVGVDETQFGPFRLPSPIKEDTKFMDVARLKQLYRTPELSQRVKRTVAEFRDMEQEVQYIRTVLDGLDGPSHSCQFATGVETYSIETADATTQVRHAGKQHYDLLIASSGAAGSRQVRFSRRDRDGRVTLSAQAGSLRLRIRPDGEAQQMEVRIVLFNAVLFNAESRTGETSLPPPPRDSYSESPFTVPMPQNIRAIEQHTPQYYLSAPSAFPGDYNKLRRDLIMIANQVQSELHSRASFAISCLILVMVGCALGMMFRSGNFLSAFAISVIPALLCITLVVAGQQTADNLPDDITAGFRNPLALGLALIWSGNVPGAGHRHQPPVAASAEMSP